jgi:hypothetical protein
MEEALRSALLANVGLAALTSTRIYWVNRPQGTALPAVVLHRISGQPDMHMTGPSGLTESRVQADCYGATYAASVGLARALEAALSGYSGTISGIKFSSITIDGIRSDYEGAEPDEIYSTSLDLMAWHAPA